MRGKWVGVVETVTYDIKGTYKIHVKDIKTGKTILAYTNYEINLWPNKSSFVRPKWGIYIGLKNTEGLRDETVLFADFSITEK